MENLTILDLSIHADIKKTELFLCSVIPFL